jgi:type I restriction enzyme, S subunit
MKSRYKRIGDFIRLVDGRNRDLKIKTLLGLSIDKVFIPSVANTVGSDMANYKIIRKGQFACSLMQVRRDKKMPVALLHNMDEAIISQAYPVFEIIDQNELLPEYLMMWMSRPEFDRHACFLAVGGVRGSLEWEDFCGMELPTPSIEKQREIVREYDIIVNRIKLNEQLIRKLEETAQAIYRHWFVDFEFPISAKYAALIDKPELKGKPYKTSGGEMVYCEGLEAEIPRDWGVKTLGELVESVSKTHNFKKDSLIFFNTSDILDGDFLHSKYSFVKNMPGQAKKSIKKWDILYSEIRPANKRYALVRVDNPDDYVVSTKLMVLRKINPEINTFRLYHFLTFPDFISTLQKSAEGRSGTFPQITYDLDIQNKPFIFATSSLEKFWNDILEVHYKQLHARKSEISKLEAMKKLLLSSLAAKGEGLAA